MIVDIPFSMKTLQKRFRKNGLDYNLVKRTDLVTFYELSNHKGVVGYELFDIPIEGPTVKDIQGRELTLPKRERMPTNEEFGKRFRSTAWIKRENAELYFNYLTSHKPSSKVTFDKYREGLKKISLASR